MLCEKMFKKKIYVTGTVRANRKRLPPSINKNQTVKNVLVAVRSEQLLSISWMDRKYTIEVSGICCLPDSPYSSNVGGLSFSYQGFPTILLLLARDNVFPFCVSTDVQVHSFPYVLQ